MSTAICTPSFSPIVSKASHLVQTNKTNMSHRLPDNPPDFRVHRTLGGEHFHLPNRSFSTIVPQGLLESADREEVTELIKAYWIEHLIQEKLLNESGAPILLHYYSQRLSKRRLERAQLEVKLYSEAIALQGLHLVESVDEMGIAESDEESDGELDSTAPTGKVMKVNG